MSVLVKGIELPEKVQVLELHPDGKVFTRKGYLVGEAVELPDKHGRLVDANEIRGRMESVFNTSSNLVIGHTWGEAYAGGFSDAIDIVKDAPTIVEAEDNS